LSMRFRQEVQALPRQADLTGKKAKRGQYPFKEQDRYL
jgi:hypothetical protein